MSSILPILIVICIALYLIFHVIRRNSKENFTANDNDGVFKKCYKYNDIFDDFYSLMYDDLFYDENYYTNLSKGIIKYMNTVYNNHLCIGIKNGGHINELLKNNMNTISITKSKSIADICKYNYEDNTYKYIKDFDNNSYIFDENTFTHISLIDNELYYTPNIYDLLNNCEKWIIHKGFLFIQLYENKDCFKKGFNKWNIDGTARLEYKYSQTFNDFENNTNEMYFVDSLSKNDKIRKNFHNLYFYEKEHIINTIKNMDFTLVEKRTLNNCESLYVFQKY